MTAQVGFIGKRGVVWTLIASWFIPLTLTMAYITLALTSETDAAGWGWMGGALALAGVLWFMFRSLTHAAAMARALAVGDADRVLEMADDVVARRRGAVRSTHQLYRGLAFEMRGDWASVLRAVDDAKLPRTARPSDRALAAALEIGALVETGELARARALLDTELAPTAAKLDSRMDAHVAILARLARGRVLCAEHAPDAAAVLQTVLDDVRTGAATRAMAHHYAARIATDAAVAEHHRARAAALAHGTWVAGELET